MYDHCEYVFMLYVRTYIAGYIYYKSHPSTNCLSFTLTCCAMFICLFHFNEYNAIVNYISQGSPTLIHLMDGRLESTLAYIFTPEILVGINTFFPNFS